MVIGIVNFPLVKPGKEAKFLEWFSWTNAYFAKQNGFISRRLINQIGDQSRYAAIIEFESYEEFKMVAEQKFHAESAKCLAEILEGMPTPILYNELIV
jgi:antibiotic biosynthesis monooxygenase (ABM) superfamily enzyme